MSNRYTGEVDFDINGQKRTMLFDWAAVAELKEQHGGPNILKTLMLEPDVKVLSSVAGIAFKRHHPEMTAEVIFDLSPPIQPLLAALDIALAFVYFGPEGLEESKKNPPRIRQKKKMRWWMPSKRRSA